MANEVQLISDGDGLAVIGNSAEVERFLSSQGLSSKELGPKPLGAVLGFTGAAVQVGSAINANSGRWVQLTEKSAEQIKQFGLMKSKETGLSLGVVKPEGDKIKALVEFATDPRSFGSVLGNPAALASVASFMAQRAMQESIDEIKEYLAKIDEKVDDILRAQKDGVIADMIGVDLLVDEAMIVRDQVGRVSEVTWSKVQATSATIARTQGYAVRQVDALAEKLERTADMRELIKAANQAEAKVQEWLAVLARCFQLQDAIAVLELDRVLDAAPEELDQHRLGLKAARENRLAVISRSTSLLIERMNAAASRANAKVLLNPFESPAVVRSSNKVVTVVVDFQSRVGIESGRQAAEARRWLEAVVDVRDKALETGAEGVGVAKRLGTETIDKAQSAKAKALDTGVESVARASEVTGKFLSGLAERARRRRSTEAEPAAEG
ncbi:hypothetical protein [Georgenia yuyongxinii]|uniref:Uncharacterized protein n=1 Tax=Georgenia yuyongxinii TaxID=2589797 RepID=A0A552WW96_9MICO|nr:hypothetical protein [Georgenia yuyongxinii]TRW47111.1 hypothetical protein FJ693_02395 [Georgenia yuyongxinii]